VVQQVSVARVHALLTRRCVQAPLR
jgi:hypothetical protein